MSNYKKQSIKFIKMHGLGNDFVIIDQKDLPSEADLEWMARYVSDRHTGIGCDQFITYTGYPDYYSMTIHNPDGSSAGACGNAVRCLVKLLYEEGKLSTVFPSDNHHLADCRIKVRERYLKCSVIKDNSTILVQVNMGQVNFTKSWMPKTNDLWQLAELYGLDPKEIICADIGNPHLVIFSALSLKEQKFLGETLEHHELFPNSVNVNFATVKNNQIHLSVYERGTGFTLACGSGACASFAAGGKLGLIQSGIPCEVIFKLGRLKMSLQDDEVIMTGEGELVARGELIIIANTRRFWV